MLEYEWNRVAFIKKSTNGVGAATDNSNAWHVNCDGTNRSTKANINIVALNVHRCQQDQQCTSVGKTPKKKKIGCFFFPFFLRTCF